MARMKYQTIRRCKQLKIYARNRPVEATSSSPAKMCRTNLQLQPVSEPGSSSNTTSTATSVLITAFPTGSSVRISEQVSGDYSQCEELSLMKLTVDSDNLDESVSSSSSDTKSTASDSSTASSHSTDADSLDRCEGYRIIDFSSLAQVIGKAAMCCKRQGELKIEESSSGRQGLASHLQLCCTECDSRHTVAYSLVTSSMNEKELNQHAVLASRLIGRGRSAMRKFFSILNMPGYMSSRTYEKYSHR